MDPSEVSSPPFDLAMCRELEVERPIVDVREDDVTAAFRTLADNTRELEDKRDFNALAKLLGFDDALGLRREVRAQLQRQSEDAVLKILRLRVLNGLLAHFDFPPDPKAIEREIASLVRDAEELGQQLTPEKVQRVVAPLAYKRVVSAMLVKSLARALDVEPHEEQILAAFNRHAELYRDPEAVIAHLKQSAAAAKPVIDELVENEVVGRVLGLARVTDRPMTLQALTEELHRVAMELGEEP